MASQADRIREHVVARLAALATACGSLLAIRSGDVVRSMGLDGRTPNVCSVLKGSKFQQMADLELVEQRGPAASTTTTYLYKQLHPVPSVPVDQDEQIEGLGDPNEDVERPVYPLDDIMVRTETRTVSEVVARIGRRRFILDPDFQRDFVWDPKKQSKLIESCVMRIPLPVLYVAEGGDGRITVVDGLQRLGTFSRFLNDELALTGLGKDHPLTGKRYSELPLNLRERVEDTQLTLYILDKSAPGRAQLDIFERVNGGEALARQQMRNAIYNGAGTRWLREMSRSDAFLAATGRSLNTKNMRDREAVNRFAGFHVLGWTSYANGDMDHFLARTIQKLNHTDTDGLATLERGFTESMEGNFALFGRHSFRKSLREATDDVRRSVLNIALFDVLSWAFARLPPAAIEEDGEKIAALIRALIPDDRFGHAITYSTNSTAQIRTRFEMVAEALSDWICT